VIVTKIDPFGKDRYRVYVEEELAFVLYRGELSHYQIKEGKELSQEKYREIVDTVLTKRAKLRCMNLLRSMDRTEYQLRQKLIQGEYPSEVIDRAIDYVKSFGYVNDRSYAERYLESRQNSKSRRQITMELMQKGISREVIQEICEEKEPADETSLILRWMEKKKYDPSQADQKEKQRMYQFLMRKGFSSGQVMKALQGEDFPCSDLANSDTFA
jgi:regulatory protein